MLFFMSVYYSKLIDIIYKYVICMEHFLGMDVCFTCNFFTFYMLLARVNFVKLLMIIDVHLSDADHHEKIDENPIKKMYAVNVD
jgi:hypothetical protein